MRLTLRTLLSYLDDTLEPAQARQIGQKVAESDVAQQLIARIKDVVRQRRLTVPPSTGPAARIDINTAAEYLDNTLPAEKLAEVEEICLEADVYLAEIAACHQILTLLQGEPARVPPPSRQRMYALSKGRDAHPRRAAAVPVPTTDGRDPANDSVAPGSLYHPRHSSWLRRFAPLAAILVVVGALAVVIWQVASQPTPNKVASADGTTKGSSEGGKDQEPKEPTRDGGPATDPDKGKTPATPPDQPPVQPPMPEKTPIDQVPAQKPSTERRVVGKYVQPVSLPSVLLQRPPEQEQWRRVTNGGGLSTTDSLVTLPASRSGLLLDSGVFLTLWGNWPEVTDFPIFESSVVLYAPPAGIDVEFLLDHGRVVLSNRKPSGEARARIRFHGEIWDLTLHDNQTVAALELWGRYPPEVPFVKQAGRGEAPRAELGLFIFSGQATLTIGGLHVFALTADTMFPWNNTGPAGRPAPLPPQFKQWWTNRDAAPAGAARDMRVALDEYSIRLAKDQASVEDMMVKTSQGKQPKERIFGINCLAAIDALGPLTDALQDEDKQRADVRDTATFTLQRWIGLGPERDQRLYNFLHDEKDLAWHHAEIIMSLLHGFSDNDLADPGTYERLIEYLRHEKLAVRSMAYFHLSRLVPKGAQKFPYDPTARAPERDQVYQQWKKYIPDGKLPPKE